MTGTAISNSPLDIYGIINWLSPKALGSFYSFCSRYVIKDFFGSPRQFIHMDELSERIKPYYIRRTKEQVLKELPEKVQIMHLVDLSEKEKKLYQNIKKMLLDELLGADMSKVEFVSQLQNGMTNLLRLRQCVDSLELLGEDKESSKLKHLKELIPTLGEGRKIIIFSEFAQMCRILNRELPDSLMIIGDIHQSLRGAIIHEFNTSTTSNILIMSSAGAFGLNLQVSDCIINYDSPWSVAKLEQREGRAHRIGQKNTVFVYSLVAHKTVDQYVRNKLMSKKDIAEQVMPISELINVLQ